MDSETLIQLLVFFLWLFGGRLLRALRGEQNDTQEAEESAPLEEEWEFPPDLYVESDEEASFNSSEEFDSSTELNEQTYIPPLAKISNLEELHALEDKLEEVGKSAQDTDRTQYESIHALLKAYDELQNKPSQEELAIPISSPGEQSISLFSKKSTSNAVLLDGFLLSEILGTPRALRSHRTSRFTGGPRVVKKP